MTMASGVLRRRSLLFRVLAFAFAMVAGVIGVVFVLLSWQTNARLTRAVVEGMEASQRRFARIEERRGREQLLQVLALAENPTLKAAIDTYHAERGSGLSIEQLQATIQMEVIKLQQLIDVPALSVADVDGVLLASAGPYAADWPAGAQVGSRVNDNGTPVETIVARSVGIYRTTAVPLVVGRDVIGEFFIASPLDDAHAAGLAEEAGTDIVILIDGDVVASSASEALDQALENITMPDSGAVTLEGQDFVVRRVSAVDAASVYAVSSVTAAAQSATSEAAFVLLLAGIGALLLAGGGSWWLAQTVATPINRLSTSLAMMAQAGDLTQPLPRAGGGRELDALADAFDGLRHAVSHAEAESEATFLGVISALANALDARDPYTAGHSQRVADLSVSIGRNMQLSDSGLEALRVGALLHDIGKIGVSDAVLRKPSKLTAEEYEHIKRHPALGARILKPLRFPDEQLAVVELHHERPDGRGYPHGLRGDDIPLFARIVHVADAFDAMTSARAYRAALPISTAVAELRRCVGADFDSQVVESITRLPVTWTPPAPEDVPSELSDTRPWGGSLVRFPAEVEVGEG